MVYADTNFFIGLMNVTDEHHATAKKLYGRFKSNIDTSVLTIAELLIGCEKHSLDPEKIIGSIFKMANVSGIDLEEAMRAAHYMKHNKLRVIDALHCALAGNEIISADKDMDKTKIVRIWDR